MHDKSCSLKAEINREIRQDLIIENVILNVGAFGVFPWYANDI
jgi:hypothetical protein